MLGLSLLPENSRSWQNCYFSYFSARLCRQPIDGIYIASSASNLFGSAFFSFERNYDSFSEWFGIIFIRRGVFGGGIFRFNLLIPRKYPLTSELPVRHFIFIFFKFYKWFHFLEIPLNLWERLYFLGLSRYIYWLFRPSNSTSKFSIPTSIKRRNSIWVDISPRDGKTRNTTCTMCCLLLR